MTGQVPSVRDLRLAALAATAWATAGMLVGAPEMARPAVVVAFVSCGGLFALAIPLRNRARGMALVVTIAVIAAIVALTALSVSVHAVARHPPILDSAAHDGRSVLAVVEAGPLSPGQSWPVSIVSVSIATVSVETTTTARIFDGAPQEEVRPGARFEVHGTLRATEPGSAVAYLLFASAPARPLEPPAPILDVAASLRNGLREAAATLPGAGGRLLPGLSIGDTRAVDASLDAAMKASALSHLTAVSGANCAVVVAIVMMAFGGMGVPRPARIVASIVVLAGFVVLVTPEPSVLRAAVMAVIALAALGAGRPMSGIVVLSGAVLVLAIADPWLSRSYGFVLSVIATASILVLSPRLASMLARVMPRGLALVIAVPLAAQLGCQPVLVLLAPAIPSYGLLANIVAAPAAPLATILGLLACVLLPFAPWVGHGLVVLAWLPASWIAAVASVTANAPGARIDWPSGAPGLVLAAVITLGSLAATLAGPRRRVRLLAGGVAAATIALLAVTAGGTRLAVDLARPAEWQLAACDVGQGDAVLVRSEGHIALIDTGPEPERLAHCLRTLGIDRVDLLVLTHFDLDHVGGASAVEGRTGVVLVGPSSGADDDGVVARLVARGAQMHRVSAGITGRLGAARWEVLWPVATLRAFEPGNDSSVVVHFENPGCVGGCLSSTFLGDLGQASQASLLRTGRVSPVDVVKVAHHGSANQEPALYAALGARLGIIGVGSDNRYGHPTGLILDLLEAAGTETERTDTQGMVLIARAGTGGFTVWSERPGVMGGG